MIRMDKHTGQKWVNEVCFCQILSFNAKQTRGRCDKEFRRVLVIEESRTNFFSSVKIKKNECLLGDLLLKIIYGEWVYF